jgi:hypothetical protein
MANIYCYNEIIDENILPLNELQQGFNPSRVAQHQV